MLNMKKTSLSFLRVLFISFVMLLSYASDPVISNTPGKPDASVEILMVSRLALPARVLDFTRQIIGNILNKRVTMTISNVSSQSGMVRPLFEKLILLEDGMEESKITRGMIKTSIKLDFGWVLALNPRMLEKAACKVPVDLSSFLDVLKVLKARQPEKFPWFESLYSPNTLARFDYAFAGNSSSEQGSEKMLDFIHDALNAGIMNPLSIEADESLAFDVFEAGDTVFASMWLPIVSLAKGSELRSFLNDPLLTTFPTLSKMACLPVIRLHLWCMESDAENFISCGSSSGSSAADVRQYEDVCDSKQELEWMEKRFPELYDALVMGEN